MFRELDVPIEYLINNKGYMSCAVSSVIGHWTNGSDLPLSDDSADDRSLKLKNK